MNAYDIKSWVAILKKFNPFQAYSLGKDLSQIAGWARQDYPLSSISWPLFSARAALQLHIESASIFGSATIRAAQEVIRCINGFVPTGFAEILTEDQSKPIPSYQLGLVQDAIAKLETVMSNDMPGVSSYVVTQKGIYRTEDLIEHADLNFPEEIRKQLPDQAKKDLIEAGKCLAFEVPTACAFHLWRAVETVMGAYYTKLTGSTFEADKVTQNWAIYIKALNDKGADSTITKFLDHIRDEYRNPQTHPEAMLEVNEALGLFGVAMSAIHQMALKIQKPK